jgi:lipopolysaccharide export system permease protein
VLVLVPGHVYEVMPMAALIGTIYTMAQFAASSEFTIMRASSMSTAVAGCWPHRHGAGVITFIFGELITPRTAPLAERIADRARGRVERIPFRPVDQGHRQERRHDRHRDRFALLQRARGVGRHADRRQAV